MKRFVLQIQLILLLFEIVPLISAAQDAPEIKKNVVKLDIIPLYYNFFDYRKQRRVGIEYEREIKRASFLGCYLDLGLYDDYSYTKYYDFFNQAQGIHYIKQDVVIKCIHILPSYMESATNDRDKNGFMLKMGCVGDFQCYHKDISIRNSLMNETSHLKYNQYRIGVGPGASLYYPLNGRISLEVRTSFIVEFFVKSTAENVSEIRPLDAQWAEKNYTGWWISNIKIGYAF